QVKQLQSTLSI
ncbi:chlamydia polymorphic membrane middle domain protein, partial [Chlamydia psittaci 02DC22]